MAQVTQEEHSKAAELRTKQNQIQFELGAIQIAYNDIETRKTVLLQELRSSNEELNSFMSQLAEKYGHGTLNIESGEFVVNEQVTE